MKTEKSPAETATEATETAEAAAEAARPRGQWKCDGTSFSEFLGGIPAGAGFSLCVTGGSMRPFLRDGVSVVSVRKAEASEGLRLRRGDVILFRRQSGYVLHRVCRVHKNGEITVNGDAQTWTERIPRSDVCGIVTEVTRTDKTVSVDSAAYRTAVFFWQLCRPLRRGMLRAGEKIVKK